MYFTGKQKKSDNAPSNASERRRDITGVPEYNETLESSFVFEAEETGFIRVNDTRKKTDETVPERKHAPIAVF